MQPSAHAGAPGHGFGEAPTHTSSPSVLPTLPAHVSCGLSTTGALLGSPSHILHTITLLRSPPPDHHADDHGHQHRQPRDGHHGDDEDRVLLAGGHCHCQEGSRGVTQLPGHIPGPASPCDSLQPPAKLRNNSPAVPAYFSPSTQGFTPWTSSQISGWCHQSALSKKFLFGGGNDLKSMAYLWVSFTTLIPPLPAFANRGIRKLHSI